MITKNNEEFILHLEPKRHIFHCQSLFLPYPIDSSLLVTFSALEALHSYAVKYS
jgi:hypothetical protein